ncbi:MAG TPA: serine hydrolase domain-containing protein [Bryobacteraceae bacterium]|nr:serine hydrolase domain-containing protein [Bryobacteraceae bacterium]
MLFLLVLFVSALFGGQDFTALDNLVESELKGSGAPGAVVAIVQGDRVAHLKAYGVANVETGEKMTTDTLFRIGSTTKIFTAAAVLSLVNDGKLDLSKPISTYVKGLDPAIGSITTHQLLSHTAGLGDRGSGNGSHDDAALGLTMRALKSDMIELTPGEIFSYSSLGYWLAGFVLEEISGKPFADAVTERVFEPTGMKGSTFRPLMAMTYPIAQQHEGGPEKTPKVIRPFADEANSWPGGSAFASGRGLANFMSAFLNSGLSAETIKRMSSPQAAFPGSPDTHYGYGLVTSMDRGVRTVSHGGARIGFGSMLTMAPDQKVGVAVVVNRSNAMLGKVAQKALEMTVKYGPDKAEAPPSSSGPAISDSAGTYVGGPIRVVLSTKDEAAEVSMDGKTYPVKSLGEGRFLAQGPVGYFVLVPGPEGKTRYMHTNLRALRRLKP